MNSTHELQVLTSAQLPKPLSYEDYDYEVHVLDNELKALLVSSEQIDKAACCIGVGIGSLQDPQDYQGLVSLFAYREHPFQAHFCEHMLFMGESLWSCRMSITYSSS